MKQLELVLTNLEALKNQWSRNLLHGVAIGAMKPVPNDGDEVQLKLVPRWGGDAVDLQGTVIQASMAASVVQLSPLSDEARSALVKLGISEAAGGASAAATPEPSSAGSSAKPAAAESVPGPVVAEPAAESESVKESSKAASVETSGPAVTTPQSAPVGQAPVGQAPVGQAPVGQAPVGQAPVGQAPVGQAPVGQAPVGQAPEGQAPEGQAPEGQAPVGQAPEGEAPVGQVPEGEAPEGEAPEGEAQVKPTDVASAVGSPASTEDSDQGLLSELRTIAAARGPAHSSTEGLLPPATVHGDFGKSPWRNTLLHLLAMNATGVLVIHAFREIRWCYLVEGEPVHYLGDQPHPGELLSDVLVKGGVVSEEDWVEALTMRKITGILPGEYLVSQGRIGRDALNLALQDRAQRITRNLMGMNFGDFSFHPLPAVRRVFSLPKVDLLMLLLEHQRSALAKVEDEDLIKQADKLYKLHVRPAEGRQRMLLELPLNDVEMHLIKEVIPAGWTLAELVGLREMEERMLLRLLFALRAMGLVEFVESEGGVAKRNRAERMLYEALAELKRRNDFEGLHAHWSSSVDDIEAGYQKILRDTEPEKFAHFEDERINALVRQVREISEAIWARLKTPQGRLESRKDVVEIGQLRMASDLLFAQGEMARYKGKMGLARVCYIRVLELDPGGPEGAENTHGSKKALADPQLSEEALKASGADLRELERKLDNLF